MTYERSTKVLLWHDTTTAMGLRTWQIMLIRKVISQLSCQEDLETADEKAQNRAVERVTSSLADVAVSFVI